MTGPLSRSNSRPAVPPASQGTTSPARSNSGPANQQAQGTKPLPPVPQQPQTQSPPPAQQQSTPPAQQQPSSKKLMDLPLDVHGHAPAGAVSGPLGDMQFGALGPDFKMPTKATGSQETKLERQGAFRTYGDLEKTGVALGQYKLEGKTTTHHAAGQHHLQAEGEASLLLATAHLEKKWDGKLGQGGVEVKFDAGLKATGEAVVLVSKQDQQAVLHAKGEALAGAQVEVTAKHATGRHLHAAGKGELKAGAWGTGQATAAFDRKQGTAMVRVGGEGWAGSEQKAQGELKLGWLRLSGGIGAKQGVGGEFKFGAGMQEGRVGMSFDVGAAVGIGASVSVGASLNTKAMKSKAHRGWDKVLNTLHHPPKPPPAPSASPTTP